MPNAMLLILQSLGTIGPPAPLPPRPPREARATPRCAPGAEEEIVVCGARDGGERFRLRPLAPTPEKAPPKAEFGIAGAVKGAVRTDAEAMPGGTISKRLMMDLKLPF